MAQINHKLLIWARETAGLSLSEACKKLLIHDSQAISAISKLQEYESGLREPDQKMIEKMSSAYRRTPIIFYLDEPPEKGNHGVDFRNLPLSFPKKELFLVDVVIRNIKVSQEIIKEHLLDDEEIKPNTFVGSINDSQGIQEVATDIVNLLNFSLRDFRKQKNPEKAFDYLRSKVENLGIFVLLIGDLGNYFSELSLEAFRGFALSDDMVPYIVINDNDAKPAFSFTLIHELVHILLGQTGVSGQFSDLAIEQFCNDVASEILLPKEDLLFSFDGLSSSSELSDEISSKALQWNVSHSLIAYKLYRKSIISYSTWIELSKAYTALWKKHKKDSQKSKENQNPTYFTVKKYKLGKNMVSYVRRFMDNGSMNVTCAARALGVNPRNVSGII